MVALHILCGDLFYCTRKWHTTSALSRNVSIKWRGKIRIDCDDRRRTRKSLSWAGGIQARVEKEIKILIDFLEHGCNWPSTAWNLKSRSKRRCSQNVLHSLWLRFGDKCLVNVGENRYLAFLVQHFSNRVRAHRTWDSNPSHTHFN